MHLKRRMLLPRISFNAIYAAFVLLVLVLQIFFWTSPTHKEAISLIYLWPAAIASYALMLYRHRQRLSPGMLLLAAMVVWTFTTCLLNGDYYLTLNRGFMLGVVLSVGLCYPTLLVMKEEQRRRWLTIFCSAMVGLMTLLCWVSFFAVATNTLIQSPFGSPPLGINPVIGDKRLYVFGEHPNGMACIFSIALFMALYLFFHTRRPWARALCVVAGISLFGGVALTVSRTVVGTISVGAGLLSVLCVLRVQRFSKKWICLLACLLTAVVVMALVFVGNQLIIDLFADLSAQAEAADAIASRAFGEGLGTFNLRDEIWAAGFQQIRERPVTLLIGMLDSDVARLPGTMIGRYDAYHMHNAYLEVLMETGLIGLGLCLAILWLLLRACFGLYFNPVAPFAVRTLSIIPVMLMLNGMLEAYPFLGGRLMDMLFFLMAGAVVACEGFYRPRQIA